MFKLNLKNELEKALKIDKGSKLKIILLVSTIILFFLSFIIKAFMYIGSLVFVIFILYHFKIIDKFKKVTIMKTDEEILKDLEKDKIINAEESIGLNKKLKKGLIERRNNLYKY